MRLFFPEKRTNFLFQELPEEIQNKIVYVYSEINEYSLRSRDVHSTPSWHKWSDFEYSPWCLAIVVHTPPGVLHILIVPYLKLNQRCKSLKFILWAPICFFFVFVFFFLSFLKLKVTNLCSIARCPLVHPLVITWPLSANKLWNYNLLRLMKNSTFGDILAVINFWRFSKHSHHVF